MESDREESRYHRLYTYPNGVTLIYFKHNVNNSTSLRVGFISGSSSDKIRGTAHFLEHMLLKETPTISLEEFSNFTKNNGISTNAYTNENMIMLEAETPNSHLDKICEYYKNFLQNRYFDKKSIALERGAIEQEIKIYEDKDKSYEGIDYSLIIPDITTNSDILGTKKSIAKINEKVLREYIDNNFVSENLVVCAVSSLEYEEVKALVDQHFEHCVQSNPKYRAYIVDDEYALPLNIFYLQNKPEQKTTSIKIMYRVDQDEKEADKFAYVEDFMFNDFAGKMLKKLRTEKGFVYTAAYYPYFLDKGLSLKALYATTSKEHVNDCISVIGQIIKDISTKGMSQEDYINFQKSIKTIEEEYKTGIKIIDPDILLDRYIHNREIFYNNQLHAVKDLSLEEINAYLKDAYIKKNIIVSIKGALNEKTLFTPKEIEKQLYAKESAVAVHSSGKLLNLDYTAIEKEPTMKRLEKLEEQGKLAHISGNVYENLLTRKYEKMMTNAMKKQGISVEAIASGKYTVIIQDDKVKFVLSEEERTDDNGNVQLTFDDIEDINKKDE